MNKPLKVTVFLFLSTSVFAQDFQVQQAHTGAWFNPDESGHGLMLEVFTDDLALMWWFTFDSEGNRTWFGGVGNITGDTITIEAYEVSGGAFPPEFDANNINQVVWGEIIIRFESCTQGTVNWTPVLDGYQSGSMPISRLTGIEQLICVEPEEINAMNINFSTTQVVLDGTNSPGEWDEAFTAEIVVNAGWTVPVAIMTNGSEISILFDNLAGPNGSNDVQAVRPDTLFPEVFIKTDPEVPTWNFNTFWFHASFQDCFQPRAWNLAFDCNFSLPLWSATNWPLSSGQASEIVISYERLGLEDNKSAELLLNLTLTSALLGNNVYHSWPASAQADQPSSWLTVVLPAVDE